MRTLCAVVAGDEYLRVLDLRGNQISEESILNDCIPNLKQNKTLTNLDLRENTGYTNKAKKLVALCLLRNLDRLKKTGLPTHKSWINPQVLLPVETTLQIAMDPRMIETANIENTAEALDEGAQRKNHRRGGSKVSPSKRVGGGILPRPATTASRKGTRNGAIAQPRMKSSRPLSSDDDTAAIRLLPTYSLKKHAKNTPSADNNGIVLTRPDLSDLKSSTLSPCFDRADEMQSDASPDRVQLQNEVYQLKEQLNKMHRMQKSQVSMKGISPQQYLTQDHYTHTYGQPLNLQLSGQQLPTQQTKAVRMHNLLHELGELIEEDAEVASSLAENPAFGRFLTRLQNAASQKNSERSRMQ
ncbi:hypothetical protein FGO68_gene15821 [Halteria grandinella]|uniref:Centrosomal protein of 78 kDa n=1 Tax=Halteria grandinella TaxID=5974 RepID=A0A8J8SVV0_HALGN|nr:hypothetical protein FGO68_gene15821 [Halteria grandinella]